MAKVLVIEDDLDILEAVQITLEINGYEVKTAARGTEGKRVAQSYQPDLIILDYFLAGSNGATICQELKSDAATKHIPIVMTSAHPSASKVVIQHGADSFIAKPFSISEFMDKVVASINRHTLLQSDNGDATSMC